MKNINNFKIFENGSTWLRADFHLHTMADKEFKYDSQDFISDYILALKNQNIRVGVITNHNKFDLKEYKQLKKEGFKEEIYLLPGVELSVNDGANGIHCLIVFDFEKWYKNNEDYINQFLEAAFEGIANRENKNTRCKYNLNDLFNSLKSHRANNRDSFIVMSHVEQRSGFLEELKGGRIQQLASDKSFLENVLGFQKLRTIELISNLKLWFKEKLPAFVEGSDCKNLEEVGKAHIEKGKEKKKFIKIGNFNFEAVKFALLDYQNRIKGEIIKVCNSYIKSVTFTGGKLDGQTINLNNNMNNLIGIRGSGKSSVLEAIRYTLDIPLGDRSQDREYKKKLVQNFIGGGGKVNLEIITRDGQKYIVEKIFNERLEIKQNGIRIPNLKIDENIIRRVYFGQKDLSSTEEGFNEAFVEKFFGNKTYDIKNSIFEKNQEISKKIREIKSIKELISQKEDVKADIASIEEKLKIFKIYQVDEKLKKQVNFNRDYETIKDISSYLESVLQGFREVVVEYKDGFDTYLKYKSVENPEIFEKLFKSLKTFNDKFNQLINILKEAKNELVKINSIEEEFSELINKLAEEFSEIKRKINQDKINPDDYINNTKSLNLLNSKLKELDKKSETEMKLKKEIDDEIANLKNLWYEDYKVYKQEIDKVNNKKLAITIDVEFKGNKEVFKNFLIDILKGSNISRSNIDKIINTYKDTIEIYYDLFDNDSKLADILSGGNKLLNFRNYVNDQLDTFLTYRVTDKYTFKYKDKILQEHSLGQRASALIIFILTMGDNDLVIIDQPEDDLDNQTIYTDVIKELCNLKDKTQFVFATHNPNIPVLGDSEQIISCKYLENKIETIISSIDNKIMQDEIVNIMEGGEDAFKKRKEIYSLWKH
ncbi:MAG: histidinol-phosphatase [Ignavibacteria bacterium]|nr:histidinol-phosphatase [Ignavibacteria bacterium]